MKTTLLLVFAMVTMPFQFAIASDEGPPDFPLDAAKSALSQVGIAGNPGSSNRKRSIWGPVLYRSAVQSTVLVLVFEKGQGGQLQIVGEGSGVVVSVSGYILTNWHVTWPQNYVGIVLYPGENKTYKELTENDLWLGQVVKLDQRRDLALLQIQPLKGKMRSLRPQLKALPLEDPNRLEVGQDVFAIGHPKGLHWTYTEGVISQIRPRYEWKTETQQFQSTVIQTQTTVSFGSSGGPLINRDGKLVGIVSNGIPDSPGLNFAIAVNEVRDFLRP